MEYFATCNEIPVHIFDSEKGKQILLFLHGYLETLYIWNEFFEILPSKYRVVAIDIPGHGLTGSHPENNSMEFCADTVISLLNRLKIEKCTFIGHSMGGYISQACLAKYPSYVERIAFFNSNPYADKPEKREERLKEIKFIQEGRLETLASIAIPNMYAKENLRRMDNKIEETIEITETHDPAGISASVRGLMERPDNVKLLNETKIPLLFVFGDKDIHSSEEKVKQLLSDIPNAEGLVIPNTGHNSFIEEPQIVLEAFLNFLSK